MRGSRRNRVWHPRNCPGIVPAVALAISCCRKPSRPERPDQPVSAGAPGVEQSIDSQIAEAVAKIDPSLLYERVTIPEEQNAFPLWAEAMERLVPLEGAEERARRLKRWREEVGDRLGKLYGREFKPSPGLLNYSAVHSYGMGRTELEEFFSGLRRADAPQEGETARKFVEWLDRNQEAFDLIDAGIARGRLQLPELQHSAPDTYYSSTVIDIALIRTAKARVLALAGDFDGAARELLAVQRMGELLAEGEGGIGSFGDIWIIFGLCASDLIWLSGRANVPQDVLERLIAGLPPLSRLGEAYAQSLRINLTKVWIPSIRETLKADDPELRRSLPDGTGKWGLDFPGEAGAAFAADFKHMQLDLIDPTETLGMLSRYYAEFIRNATGTWKGRLKGLDAELKQWRKSWEEPYKAALESVRQVLADDRAVTEDERARLAETMNNAMGRSLLVVDLPAMNTFLASCFRFRAEREATRAVIALRLYEIRHGELPATLAELVEDNILKAVPRDFFSDGELLYSRERRSVWSVGPDETDDGGDPGDADLPLARRKDEVWRIPASR